MGDCGTIERKSNEGQVIWVRSAGASSNNTLTEFDLETVFDLLAEDSLIQYDYSFLTEIRNINGIRALEHKPADVHKGITLQSLANDNPRPGSDIFTAGTEVCTLGPAHFLAFNGFSSYRPHCMILTANWYRRQREPLDIEDYRAIHRFLNMHNSEFLVFFNCKAEAGCSRDHKHLQAIPKMSFEGEPWLNLDHYGDALPFTYYERKFAQDLTPHASLELYQQGLQQVERSLVQKTTEDDGAPPHYMIMDRGRMVIIPRRAAGIYPLGANSGGMLGMIWVKSEETMRKWLEIGPDKIITTGGIPKTTGG
ncbi:hypothetical protein FSARC_14243 [Fusarium sarcochroum]|uniref:ATP adenylyltransferase n=1 Tax=Fusarium sarcochroum TaxID=1208366 RepID=A0A8H4SV56_9HYPO|nr:hypothetical protein FSARC_14243 [Fusarium sarcochroum]